MVTRTDFWKHRKVLVTGATGILGSHLTGMLVHFGADVVVLVRDHVSRSLFFIDELEKKTTVVRGDMRNYALLIRVLNEYEIDTVFHLAAQTIVDTGRRSPISTFESNIKGTWVVLEACRQSHWVKRIVVASSDKAYGQSPFLPYTENLPLIGEYPYDVSKSCTDLIAQSYFKTYHLPVCVTRCGNFYGPGDLNWNRIVPGTIRSLIIGEPPIIRSDGKYMREYLYIEDAADAYLTLAEQIDRPDVCGQAFNISSQTKATVLDIVNEILRLFPSSLEPIISNTAKGEIRDQYLSSEKTQKILGWQSRWAMDEGLKKTIQWYKEFFSRIKA